jgi:hypothetical protein
VAPSANRHCRTRLYACVVVVRSEVGCCTGSGKGSDVRACLADAITRCKGTQFGGNPQSSQHGKWDFRRGTAGVIAADENACMQGGVANSTSTRTASTGCTPTIARCRCQQHINTHCFQRMPTHNCHPAAELNTSVDYFAAHLRTEYFSGHPAVQK